MGHSDNHWCELGFAEPAVVFKGPTQTARSVTEAWVALHGFCPNCAADRLPTPPAIVIPGGGERSETEARNPAAPKATCSRTGAPGSLAATRRPTGSRSRAPLGSGLRRNDDSGRGGRGRIPLDRSTE